jgi:hypothetical protein
VSERYNAEVDGHRSDAATDQACSAPYCAAAFNKSLETCSRGLNPSARFMFMKRADDLSIREATTTVLEERAAR